MQSYRFEPFVIWIRIAQLHIIEDLLIEAGVANVWSYSCESFIIWIRIAELHIIEDL